MEKILTVSVAAYNVENYLSDALSSCLVPNADKLEVVIVNDGSTDGTLSVAKHYQQLYPEVFRVVDKANGGYGSTINASLSVARGRYFRYLDGDDWFDSSVLSDYISLIEACDEDVIYSPYLRVFEDGMTEPIDDLERYRAGIYGIGDDGVTPQVLAATLAYKTELLRKMHFEMSEHCYYSDIEFALLPMVHAKTIRVTKKYLYCYRKDRDGQSMSLSGIAKHYKDVIRVRMRLLDEAAKFDASNESSIIDLIAANCAGAYFYLTRISAKKDRKKALMIFDSELKRNPNLYRRTGELSTRARVLRMTSFHAYGILCFLSTRRSR